jgi:hypothetical protein
MIIVTIVRLIVVLKIHPQELLVRFYNLPEVHFYSFRSFLIYITNLEKNRLSSSSSPLSNDIKIDPLNNKSQTIMSSLSPQHQTNRHYCNHPDCSKVNIYFRILF